MTNTKRPRDEFKYVYYHQTWSPSLAGPLSKLLEEGRPFAIEEYDISVGKQKKYFCPRCGYPCHRVPESGRPNVKGALAAFKHFPSRPKRPCNFRAEDSEGKKYDSEVEKRKAIEDGRITIVSSWLSKIDEDSQGDDESGNYSGIHEDKNGLATGRSIGRHIIEKRETFRHITTLQFILDHFPRFYGQDIQLPDFQEPQPFADIFVHASKANEHIYLNESAIFWGKVENENSIALIDEFVCIAFGYKTHCLSFVWPKENLLKRGLNINDLIGKYVAIADVIKVSPRFQDFENNAPQSLERDCYRVGNRAWGGFGVFKAEMIKYLPIPTGIEFIDPVLHPQPTPEARAEVEGFASALSDDVAEAVEEEIECMSDDSGPETAEPEFQSQTPSAEVITTVPAYLPTPSSISLLEEDDDNRQGQPQRRNRLKTIYRTVSRKVATAIQPIGDAIARFISWIISLLSR